MSQIDCPKPEHDCPELSITGMPGDCLSNVLPPSPGLRKKVRRSEIGLSHSRKKTLPLARPALFKRFFACAFTCCNLLSIKYAMNDVLILAFGFAIISAFVRPKNPDDYTP